VAIVGQWSAGTCAQTPCALPLLAFCRADYNHSGKADMADVLDFVSVWMDGGAAADYNGDGAADVEDVFDFLNVWLGGC
jgi:hypothetical protein